ncbi:MAG: AAA family ATPase [Candidatus Harrisonbacteria bacterium]|nr:AAA family ATPase [Candidatus Harrisonbacteria bacterium]
MHKRTLIFIGGVPGAGKTALSSWMELQYENRIKLLNPGELFRRYFYKERIKTIEEIEELIAGELGKALSDSAAVAHWHYAVRRPSGYIPQISFSRLRRLAKSGQVDRALLLLIDAPAEVIRERRLRDQAIKKREPVLPIIHEELWTEEEFWVMHQALFSDILGDDRVTALRLANIDFCKTKANLEEIFSSFLLSKS